MIPALVWLKNNWQTVIVGALLIVVLILGVKSCQQERAAETARVDAQNRIAELSAVVEESEGRWSRLAQERGDTLTQLQEVLPELAETIRQRDEQIAMFAHAVGTIRPIQVVIRQGAGAEQSEVPGPTPTDPVRARVEFNTLYEEMIRIQGYTLTNPAEANVGVTFERPINFTTVTTQLPDLSWRTYIESDLPGLTIGDIESTVNPLSRPADRRSWEQDIGIGIFGGASVTGNAGIFGAEASYDFGAVEAGIGAGGITYPNATDFLITGRITLAPFDL